MSVVQDKCYQYWPDQGCWMYGNVRVAVEDFTVLVDYTIRKFCIQYVSVSTDVWGYKVRRSQEAASLNVALLFPAS